MIGYVYILVNHAFPDLVKIGRTIRSPSERADELYTTGTPGKFIVVHEAFVSDCIAVENEMHEAFREERYSESREFFKVPVSQAIEKLQQTASNYILNSAADDQSAADDHGVHFVYLSLIAYPSSKSLIRFGSLVTKEVDRHAIEATLSEDLSRYYTAFGRATYKSTEIEILRIENVGQSRMSFKKSVDAIIVKHIAQKFEEELIVFDGHTLDGICGSYMSDASIYEIKWKVRGHLHELREAYDRRAAELLSKKNSVNF